MNKETSKEVLHDLKTQWYDFVKTKVISDKIRPVILESWQRCLEIELDPHQKKVEKILSEKDFKQLLKENEELIEVSDPIMQNLNDFIVGSGFLVTLISKDGIILKIIGDEDVKKSVKRGNFVEGADWSEKSAGTNAIGTALLIGEPLQTFAYEHFCICSHRTTCSCSPIRDLLGNIIGAIDLSGDFFNVNEHTLGMSVAAANAIENCMRIRNEEQKCHLSDTYKNTIIDSISEGIIATDSLGNITHINGIATEILFLDGNVLSKNIRDVLPLKNEEFFSIFLSAKYYTDEEVSILTANGNSRFTITSRPIIINGYGGGTVVVINEIKRAKKIAQRLSGAQAKLTFNHLVGNNKLFLETIKTAKLAARSSSNVLLLGESGTGKDIFAQSIHNESLRRNKPFVAINCGAIPKELISSELFGFNDGAFTGAKKGGNPGKFELADGGTIFLDEIGEMPLELQVNLLRVIEEKSIIRIGGTEVIPVDVRIIAATNKNLTELVAKNYFREDLFYRINVLTIKMVPLRERMDDIPILVEHLYQQSKDEYPNKSHVITEDYLKALQAHDWPGNIRELQNVVERSVNLSVTGNLELDCLPAEVRNSKKEYSKTNIAVLEKELLSDLMQKHNGNITRIANDMGIARTTLYRKLNKYGLGN